MFFLAGLTERRVCRFKSIYQLGNAIRLRWAIGCTATYLTNKLISLSPSFRDIDLQLFSRHIKQLKKLNLAINAFQLKPVH